jgi:hypothetical protein
MAYEANAVRLLGEVHCYFPEWADRPDSAGPIHEADHNSYLAGGYAEEFGYHLRPDSPPVFPPLIGDPDRSREWSVQLGCLHPGYPECPRPADRASHASAIVERSDGLELSDGRGAALRPSRVIDGTMDAARHAGVTHIVPVDRRGADRRGADRRGADRRGADRPRADRRGAVQRSGVLRPITTFWARLLIRSGVRDHRI